MVDDIEDGPAATDGGEDADADTGHAAGDDAGGEHAAGENAGSGEDDAGIDQDQEFSRRVAEARDLLSADATALYVGVVREGREVDSTFAQQADGPQQEGMQALSLLASHIRLVADEAGVDYTTVAADAVTLAEQLDESE